MKRSSINFIVDLAGFLDLVCLAASGSIMKYVLPPGSGGQGFRGGRGTGEAEELLGLTRHEWGDIHFWLAAAFVVLMFVHIILHWNWIKCYVRVIFAREECASDPGIDEQEPPNEFDG